MSESTNPFEAAMNQTEGAGNPFGQEAAANPFGSPAPQQPAVSLGSEAAAPNPFDAPAQPPAAIPAAESPMPPAQPQPPAAPPVAQAAPVAAAMPVQTAIPMEQPQQPLTSNETGQVQLPFDAAGQTPPQPAGAGEAQNPIAAVLGQQEAPAQVSIYARAPVFEHGSVKEDIEDVSQTFEELRVAKAEDFPELEDAVRVSWEISYGKVRKMVYSSDAKKKKIGEFKATIESSKEFTDALKKGKDKNPVCTIKPKVTAQSKGERMPVYKGVFTNLDEAEASGKTICIVPGSDGKVYEIRKEEAGTFTMPVGRCRELSEVEAGFIPALPLIPRAQLMQVITFFRSLLFTDAGGSYEAIANIVWDKREEVFLTCIPKQTVSAVRADSDLTNDHLDSDRYLHYMDIHSHNLMPAKFSARDDWDEKATRLYTVIGRLDQYLPEISVRMSCGGRHLPIDPNEVFEPFHESYPDEWHDRLSFSDAAPKEPAASEALDDPDSYPTSSLRALIKAGLWGEAA